MAEPPLTLVDVFAVEEGTARYDLYLAMCHAASVNIHYHGTPHHQASHVAFLQAYDRLKWH